MRYESDWTFYVILTGIGIFGLFFSSQLVYGETLYGNSAETGIFVAFDDNLSKIVYKSALGTSTHYDVTIKEYKHGGFILKSPEIVIFGHPQGNDKYTLLVMTSIGFERFTANVIQLITEDVDPVNPEPTETEKTSDSILDEYWNNKENTVVREADKKKEIVVVEPEKKEIVIVSQMARQVPWMSNYVVDLKVYDPEINKKLDYYWRDGRIQGVEITGKVLDPNGEILKSFSGNTSQFGHFSEHVYIPVNSNTNHPFTIEILASKYFDDSLATFSLLQQFSVYAPNLGGGSPSCSGNDIKAPNGTCVPKCINGTVLDTKDWMCKEMKE